MGWRVDPEGTLAWTKEWDDAEPAGEYRMDLRSRAVLERRAGEADWHAVAKVGPLRDGTSENVRKLLDSEPEDAE